MRFGEPWALLGLLLVPLVFAARMVWIRQRRRILEDAGDLGLLSALTDGGPNLGQTRVVSALLFAGALAATCVALARPQYGLRTEVRQGRGMDVVVALDLSRSMFARDVVPSRLDRAKIEIGVLLDRLKGDRVGLVGFTSIGLPLCPLTVDHTALRIQLAGAEPSDLPRGGTSVASAIRAAERMLEAAGHPDADRAIVILTDGEAHQGDPAAAARAAAEKGIEIHVAGVGSLVGEPIPELDERGRVTGYVKDRAGKTVVSRLDADTLEALASAGNGKAALPAGEGGLDLDPIARRLSSLRKADLEERTVRVYEERYLWALAPAFLLLLLSTLIRPSRSSTREPPVVAGFVFATLAVASPADAQDVLQKNHPEVERGLEALRAGQPEVAKEAFDAAEQALGRDPRITYDRALADAARGELDLAMEGFRAAAERSEDPNLRARARVGLGNALRKLKKYGDAAAAYREALLEDPSVDAARRNLEIAQRMKVVQAAQPPSDNEGDGEGENDDEGSDDGEQKPDEGGDSGDAGVSDASSSEDGGASGDDGESPDAGTSDGGDGDGGGESGQGDAGVEDAPSSGAGDAGDDSREKDAGASSGGESGGDAGPSGGADGGSGDAGGGGGAPMESEPADLSRQEAEAILDALQAEEKALERKRLLERFKGRPVEKDW